MQYVDPLALELARLAAGLSQSALSRALDGELSQAWISNAEAGKIPTTESHARLIADALGCPAEYLAEPIGGLSTGNVCAHFRKRSDLSVTKGNQLSASLMIAQHLASTLPCTSTSLPQEQPDDEGYTTPEDIARMVRSALSIPEGPIRDLPNHLAKAGIMVVALPLGSDRVDALSQWPEGGRPLVMVASDRPGDRLRFTLAHETGHVVMHRLPRDNQELEADQFAAEFLMPASQLRGRYTDLSLAKLAALKLEWGTSMAALLRRGRDIGEVSERQYRSMNIEMSRAGYRRREPVEIEGDSVMPLSVALKGCPQWVQASADWLESSSQTHQPERSRRGTS